MQVSGQCVMVTGAASGLGAAVVEAMLARGAYVLALDLSAMKQDEKGLLARQVDICSEADVQNALKDAVAQWGAVRACINCAGILQAGKVVGREGPLSLALFRRVIEVNLIGSFNVVRLAAAAMASNEPLAPDGERGVIINTGSIAGIEGQVGQSAYAASKAGIIGLTLPLARDLAPLGIRVNTICPGVFDTQMMAGASDALLAGLRDSIAFPRRLGRPAEFAALVLQLCENSYLNGEVIRLDGAARLPMH